MTLAAFLHRPITLREWSVTGTDVYGRPLQMPVDREVLGYWQQTNTSERQVGGIVQSADVLVVLPVSALPLQDDLLVLLGDEAFQPQGEPWEVYNPRLRRVTHVEFRAVRAAL